MTNEYALIDVATQNETVRELAGPGRRDVVDRVLAAPGRYAPYVLMALGAVLVDDGRRAEGAFWFYAGQLRARFDAHRCTDPTAAAACGALTEALGHAVNRFAFHEPGLLPGLIERVVAWDAATPHDYDQRWIALHGLGAFGDGAPRPLSTPAEGWEDLAAGTRARFLHDVHELFGVDGEPIVERERRDPREGP